MGKKKIPKLVIWDGKQEIKQKKKAVSEKKPDLIDICHECEESVSEEEKKVYKGRVYCLVCYPGEKEEYDPFIQNIYDKIEEELEE
ncbi:hypothetical protein KY332_01545 [Candidatus Woesearchaeota archaeon]|nr:hypothetical protein [Candidatus Woesearchaeota archaeon]